MNAVVTMDAEDKALQAYMQWKADARTVRTLFQNASMQIPPALAKLLGEEAPAERTGVLQIFAGTLPEGFSPSSWIFVQMVQATVRTLVLVALRESLPGGMTARDLHEHARRIRPATNDGSIANLGTTLAGEGLIRRDAESGVWTLTDRERAPLLHESAAWGPLALFTSQEVALYRRDAIRMVLRKPDNKGGLQQAQIVDQLKNLRWMNAPVTKDIVKLDISAMLDADELIRVPGGKVRLREAQEAKS